MLNLHDCALGLCSDAARPRRPVICSRRSCQGATGLECFEGVFAAPDNLENERSGGGKYGERGFGLARNTPT